ncbi:MAG: MdtA/MuxA family multidrug efflux RND transporter periplasmic adaptor subunit [Rhodospirillales bacterium]|nr:MdtA/MuxA family multidrug efflux RND transporter periplasmic adaptor subunit [Rhodospirillales bacterium]
MAQTLSEPSPPASPRRGRRPVRFVLLLLLIALAVLVWYRWPAGGVRGGGQPPQPVGVTAVVTGSMPIVMKGLGTVTSLASITVRTQINGQLLSLGFKEGQMVRKGDVLAQIDPRPYQAALAQAEGQLARDQALQAQARSDLLRYQTLARQDSISRQQVDDQAFLVSQYAGAVAVDQGQIAADKLNIAYCRITAPVDGRVGLRQVDPGNYVQTSDTNGIVSLTQLTPISVIFSLPEDDLPQIMKRLGSGATLPVSAYDRADVTKLAEGTLHAVDNLISTTTGTVNLRADFPNADGALFPNQFVNAHLLVDTLKNALLVPNAAVQIGVPGSYVYVVNADSTVSVAKVTTGPTDGIDTVITKGLTAGQRVVTDGADRLSEGAKVVVVAGPGAVAGKPAVAPAKPAAATAPPSGPASPVHAKGNRQGG